MVDFMTYIPSNQQLLSSFSETEVAAPIPYIEGSATYGLIPANFRQFTSTGGSTGTENRLFKCSTGTSVGGYGAIQSFRACPSRVGQGVRTRFSGYFSTGIDNSWQGIGLISVGEEMSFGYNGADFGVWHRYGGLPEVRTITVSTAATGSETVTLTLNGVGYDIPVTSGTTTENAAEIAAWLNDSANQGIWGADQVSNEIIVNALSDGAKSGSYTISSDGDLDGSIAQDTAGVTKTSDFIAQTSWNINTMAGIDSTKGNVYQIQCQNMGYGATIYSVLDPTSAEFVDVHRINWQNTTTTLGMPNPSMRSGMYCVSLGSTTNLDVFVSGFSVCVEGQKNRTRNPRGADNTQSITTTNETQIISLRNRKTYNGYSNQITIQPLSVSVTNETARDAVVRVRATTIADETQTYELAGTNLVGDVAKNDITFTSGRDLAKISLEPEGKAVIDLQELQVNQPPSLILTVTVERGATGGANTNFTGVINWYEDL